MEGMIGEDTKLVSLLRYIPRGISNQFLNQEGELEVRTSGLLVYRALQLQAKMQDIELPKFDPRAIGILNAESQDGVVKEPNQYLVEQVNQLALHDMQIHLMLQEYSLTIPNTQIGFASVSYGILVYRSMDMSANPITLAQRYNSP